MTLYLGANNQMPRINFDKRSPAFNTKELDESEYAVRSHFSQSNVLYVGTDQGCGCGFRHALLADGEWLDVVDEDNKEQNKEQKNHQDLLDYIGNYSNDVHVEIYGCWAGDVIELPQSREVINGSDLINKDFYFKERGFYQVRIK
ncbi:hypothetical protein ACX0G9_18570 [Flavitalea flava]